MPILQSSFLLNNYFFQISFLVFRLSEYNHFYFELNIQVEFLFLKLNFGPLVESIWLSQKFVEHKLKSLRMFSFYYHWTNNKAIIIFVNFRKEGNKQ